MDVNKFSIWLDFHIIMQNNTRFTNTADWNIQRRKTDLVALCETNAVDKNGSGLQFIKLTFVRKCKEIKISFCWQFESFSHVDFSFLLVVPIFTTFSVFFGFIWEIYKQVYSKLRPYKTSQTKYHNIQSLTSFYYMARKMSRILRCDWLHEQARGR